MEVIYGMLDTELGFCVAMMCVGLFFVAFEWMFSIIEKLTGRRQ